MSEWEPFAISFVLGILAQLIRQLDPPRLPRPRRIVVRVLGGGFAGLTSLLLTWNTLEQAPFLAYGLAALAGWGGLEWLQRKSQEQDRDKRKEDKDGSR